MGAGHWVKDPLEETFKLLAGASFFLYALASYLLGRDGIVRFRRTQESR